MDWAAILRIVQLIEMVLKQLVGSGRGAARSAGASGPAPDTDKLAKDIAAYLESSEPGGSGSARLS